MIKLEFGIVVLALAISLGLAALEVNELEEMHCTKTGQSRVETVMIPVTVIVNNMPITNLIPTLTTTYKYTCDDGERWR